MCVLYLFTFVSILLFVEIFTALASKQTCHKMLGYYGFVGIKTFTFLKIFLVWAYDCNGKAVLKCKIGDNCIKSSVHVRRRTQKTCRLVSLYWTFNYKNDFHGHKVTTKVWISCKCLIFGLRVGIWFLQGTFADWFCGESRARFWWNCGIEWQNRRHKTIICWTDDWIVCPVVVDSVCDRPF